MDAGSCMGCFCQIALLSLCIMCPGPEAPEERSETDLCMPQKGPLISSRV